MTNRVIRVAGGRAGRPALSAYEQAMLGAPVPADGAPSPVTSGPPITLKAQFEFQSYFNGTIQSYGASGLFERAILDQPANEEIVPSTARDDEIAGYAVALHACSQTPVAIQFRAGTGSRAAGAGGVVILTPGQFVRPVGLVAGGASAFGGFRWGLPFGWLGGGMAVLLVFQSPDGYADYAAGSGKEIQFHRARMHLEVPTNPNWPLRFPGPYGVAGTNSLPQRGQPTLTVEPTRFVARYNGLALPAPARVLMKFNEPDDFSGKGSGYAQTEFTFPAGIAYPVVEVSGIAARLGGDACIASLVNVDNDLPASTIDVVRYGRL